MSPEASADESIVTRSLYRSHKLIVLCFFYIIELYWVILVVDTNHSNSPSLSLIVVYRVLI